MITKKLDAAPILRQLAEIRRAIPYLQPGLPPPGVDGRAPDRLAKAKALEIYYAAEELARDPEHAELIPHVARMREAYERDYGVPIPPKGES